MNDKYRSKILDLIESLTNEQIKDLCLKHFPAVYKNFDGKSPGERKRDLFDYVDKQNRTDCLLRQIKNINPTAYSEIMEPFKDFDICNFNLISSIDKCWKQIHNKKGLIFLSISCSNETFVRSFCKRLEKKSNNRTDNSIIKIYTVSTTNGNKIERISKNIVSKHNRSEDRKDIIFPIDINACDRAEDIIKLLDYIQKESHDKKHRSIIIMCRTNNFSYPPEVVCLDPPKFQKHYLSMWIEELIQALSDEYRQKEWEEEWHTKGDLWLAMAENKLISHDDDAVNVDHLYEHLVDTLNYIKEEHLKISPEGLLSKVQENLKQLTE